MKLPTHPDHPPVCDRCYEKADLKDADLVLMMPHLTGVETDKGSEDLCPYHLFEYQRSQMK